MIAKRIVLSWLLHNWKPGKFESETLIKLCFSLFKQTTPEFNFWQLE